MPVSAPGFELVRPIEAGQVRHALFDFDGTISLIREGWQGIMVPLMVRTLLQTPRHEPEEEVETLVSEYVARTTGVQTIYQMIGLAEMVAERGGTPRDPLEYKREYLERLWERIRGRVEGLKAGAVSRADLMVPGAAEALEALRSRGVRLYLASGTDVEYVRDEAAALGVADAFEGRIYGAVENWRDYSKAQIIAEIIREHGLRGPELVTFGDGYVEIEETAKVGGLAVGVASDEVRRGGLIDAWKRERLIRAGAHIIVPDLAGYGELTRYLCG